MSVEYRSAYQLQAIIAELAGFGPSECSSMPACSLQKKSDSTAVLPTAAQERITSVHIARASGWDRLSHAADAAASAYQSAFQI
jgi:hypothetical protein